MWYMDMCVEGTSIDIHSHISDAAHGTFTASLPFPPSSRWPCSWHTIACTRLLCSPTSQHLLNSILIASTPSSSPSSSFSYRSPIYVFHLAVSGMYFWDVQTTCSRKRLLQAITEKIVDTFLQVFYEYY